MVERFAGDCGRGKNSVGIFFLETCRKINFFPCSFCVVDVSGRRVLGTVIHNTLTQIVCS